MQAARARKPEYKELYTHYYNKAREEKLRQSQLLLAQKNKKHKTKRRIAFFKKSMAICFIVFGLLSLVLFRYAQIFEKNYNVEGLEHEIAKLKLEKESLQAQMDSVVVLENVEQVAIHDLGMQYPKAEQIVYLNQRWDYKLDGNQEIEVLADTNTINIFNNQYTAFVNIWLSDE